MIGRRAQRPDPRPIAATDRSTWRAGAGLAALAALLTLPFPTALALVLTLTAVRVALAAGRWMRRYAVARRAARHAEPGVTLGRDARGQTVMLTDRQLAAHALIVGASGSGKSTTLSSILADHIARGRPVVVIDMKGSAGFERQLRAASAAAGRGLRVWSPEGRTQWNPLAHGNATALKDMLISTERFSEPHYQRAAERYLQTALTVLHALNPERPAHLHEVVAMMEPARLATRLRDAPPALAARVGDYLGGLTPDQESAVRGMGTRLALLSESSAGRYLAPDPHGGRPDIDLADALRGGDVVLMSLNANVYGKLAAQLGALAIQSLTSATGERLREGARTPPQATIAIDEFSALGADNVLALLARGRESGVTTLVATQELADLERAGRGFRDQVLGIVGVTIAHRQAVHTSATMISQLAGTEQVWDEVQTIRSPFARPGAARGTRRLVERPVVHPNEIKTLDVGRAVLLTSLPTSGVARLTIMPPRPAAADTPAAAPGTRPAGPDTRPASPRQPTPRDILPAPENIGPAPENARPSPAGRRPDCQAPRRRRDPPDQAPGVTR